MPAITTNPSGAGAARSSSVPRDTLCLETQSREIMASLVNDVVADALRLGLYDKPGERVVKANGAQTARKRDAIRHG